MADEMGSRRRARKSAAWLAAMAALLLVAPACAHWADFGLATVEVYDRNDGSVLPVYDKDGRRYVVGTPGHEYTLRVRLKESFSPFLTSWGDTYIVPAHILEGVADPNTAEFNTKSPVGTGPFKFASRVAGDHLVLRANESYHGQPPTLERVIFKYIPDLTVLYTQFKTGAVDVTGMQGISAEFFR